MMQNILALILISAIIAGCAVLRPPLAPHRSNTPEHAAAKTIQDCLKCHNATNTPHPLNRGDCLKCHRLETGD